MSKINSFEETEQETADRYVRNYNITERFRNNEENEEQDSEYIESIRNTSNVMKITDLEGQ